jgi:hypothetical protein
MRAHIFLAVLAVCIFPLVTSAQTAEEIIDRNIAARGGPEKFEAIHSMVVRTHEEANWGGTGTSVLRIMRPDRMRFDYAWQANLKAEGITIIEGFDGQKGWQTDLYGGKQKGKTMTGDELEAARGGVQNQFEESLSNLQAKGNKVELVGMEAVEGKPCYKIRFSTHTGRVRYAYYNAESFLLVRNDQVLSKSGKEKRLTTMISDYRPVNEILFPHTFISISYFTCPFASAIDIPWSFILGGRKSNRMTSTVGAIEINPAMDESAFQMPATIR